MLGLQDLPYFAKPLGILGAETQSSAHSDPAPRDMHAATPFASSQDQDPGSPRDTKCLDLILSRFLRYLSGVDTLHAARDDLRGCRGRMPLALSVG
jgi:hypothetical protein